MNVNTNANRLLWMNKTTKDIFTQIREKIDKAPGISKLQMLAKNKAKKHIKIYEEIQGYIEEINKIDNFMNDIIRDGLYIYNKTLIGLNDKEKIVSKEIEILDTKMHEYKMETMGGLLPYMIQIQSTSDTINELKTFIYWRNTFQKWKFHSCYKKNLLI